VKIDAALTCPRREGVGQYDGLLAFASALLSGLSISPAVRPA